MAKNNFGLEVDKMVEEATKPKKPTKYEKWKQELNDWGNGLKAKKYLSPSVSEMDYDTARKWYEQGKGYEEKSPLEIAQWRRNVENNYGVDSPEVAGFDAYLNEKGIKLPEIDAYGNEKDYSKSKYLVRETSTQNPGPYNYTMFDDDRIKKTFNFGNGTWKDMKRYMDDNKDLANLEIIKGE